GHARTIVAAADAAVVGLSRLADGDDQLARIGYVQSATYRWIGVLAAAARQAGVGLQLVASPGLRQLEAIRSRQLDAGLIRLDSVQHDVTGLEHRTLAHDPLYAVVRDGDPVDTESITADDLRDRALILYPETEGPGLRRLVQQWLNRTGRLKITDAWDAPSAVALAAAGTGIAVLPSPLPPLPANCRAVPLDRSPQLSLAVVWHPHRDALTRRILDRLPEL
uniref:LysR substrate-binding domain-containing protein n=1 Tax=Microlunatus speluncae TaxID=2594267 RepID=UPI00126668F7